MNILVTICGRGGSRGLPNKNLLPLAGKPLIVHSIEVARHWGKARRVVCSTDSDEIAAVALAAGAEVPFKRPAELATDTAGKIPVIRHALHHFEAAGESYDLVVDLDTTAPVRTVEDLDRCLAIFEQRRPEVLFSVTRARKNPYFNMVERRPDGSLGLVKTLPGAVLRRQDAPAVYDLNASIYVYDARALSESRFPGVLQARFEIYEMPEESAYDIDSALDFDIVSAILRRKAATSS